MQNLKRISLVAFLVYSLMLPLSLLNSKPPTLGSVVMSGNPEGHRVKGEVIFHRGGEVNFFGYHNHLTTGVAEFEWSTGREVSTADVLRRISSNEISHSRIDWSIHWGAFLLTYGAVWLNVGFIYWIATRNRILTPREVQKTL